MKKLINSLLRNRKKEYSWKYIDKACKHIASQWTLETPRVIGIARGGLIPATLIAKYLKAGEVYSIGLKSYADDSAFAEREHVPIIYQSIDTCRELEGGYHSTGGEQPILIVDDISDEGKTLQYISDKMKPGAANCFLPRLSPSLVICTATIFIKQKTNFVPEIYYNMVPDDQWVVFPWEK